MDRINLETYPKSGTGYLYSSLKLSFLDYLIDFPSHTIYGFNKKNLITIVRNPIDSISSWAYETKDDVNYLINKFSRVLDKILEKKDDIYVVFFDEYINEHQSDLEKFAMVFGLKGYKKVSKDKIFEYMTNNLSYNLPQNHSLEKVEYKTKILDNNDFRNVLQKYQEVKDTIYKNQ